MKKSKKLSDYLDIGFLQTLQDHCSRAMGLAFVTVDYRGVPITRYSGFTSYCQQVREHRDFFEMCKQCDAHGGLQAAITGEPYIYRCHAGLVDFALPLIYDGVYMGSLMGGQIRLNEEEQGKLNGILPIETDWQKDKALGEAYRETQMVSYEKIKSSVTLLHDFILLMVQGGRTEEDTEKEYMAQAEKSGADRAFSFEKNEFAEMKRQGRLRYFFFVMNIIAQFAYQEKAAKTEAIAYDFADVMRYVVESDHEISTLGEELNYVEALLRIQKAWAGDTFHCAVSVPKEYGGLNCPYMALEPLARLAASGCGAGVSHEIELSAAEEKGYVHLTMVSDHAGVTLDELEAELAGSSQEEGFSLHDSDRNLKRIFGKRCGISVGLRKDGKAGYMIDLCLPGKKEG